MVRAEPADDVVAPHPTAREYAERAVDLFDLPGVAVAVEGSFPEHVGLGSGTATALSVLVATARAHGRGVDPRALAPVLGRGGRSGVGVAAFGAWGAVVDAGRPAAPFTGDPPERGEWRVPAVTARHAVPGEWRFLLVVPDVAAGRSGAVVVGADGVRGDGRRPGGGGAGVDGHVEVVGGRNEGRRVERTG